MYTARTKANRIVGIQDGWHVGLSPFNGDSATVDEHHHRARVCGVHLYERVGAIAHIILVILDNVVCVSHLHMRTYVVYFIEIM